MLREPWETLDDKVRQRTYELALERVVDLEEALRSVVTRCENVIYNCRQEPADNDRHLRSWESVRDYAKAAIG